MTPSREQIVAQARTWLGTKFHHQGRLKKTEAHGGGCDCIGLVVGVCQELDIRGEDGLPIWRDDHQDYGRVPDGVLFKAAIDAHALPINTGDIKPADVLLFKFRNYPQHIGIVSNIGNKNLGLIHCYAGARKVVEHHLDDQWRGRIVQAYRFPHLAEKA